MDSVSSTGKQVPIRIQVEINSQLPTGCSQQVIQNYDHQGNLVLVISRETLKAARQIEITFS